MLPYMILTCCIFLFTFQSVFCSLYSKERNGKGGLVFSIIYGFTAGLCTLIIVCRLSFRPSLSTVLMGLLNAIVLLTYNSSLQKASRLGSYAFMMIFSLAGSILLPTFVDAVIMKEGVSWTGIIGIVLVICAGVLMNKNGLGEKKSGKFLFWTAVLFVTNGLYNVLLNVQQRINAYTQRNEMVIVTFLGMGLITFVLSFLKGARNRKENRPDDEGPGSKMTVKAAVFAGLSSLCATVAVHLFVYLMQLMDMTVMNAVNSGGVLVLSALAGVVLFKDELKWNGWLGILAGCAGIVMLSV